jgi:hypothetical protein
MAFLGEPLQDQPGARILETPRCTKDWIEEELFEQRRDLFSEIDLVFFDTTSIYFEGEVRRVLAAHDRPERRHRGPSWLTWILGVEAVQTVLEVPWSHPFVERLVGTIRREYLDHLLFWNEEDLERKLKLFQGYYDGLRMHQGLDGDTPDEKADSPGQQQARLEQ